MLYAPLSPLGKKGGLEIKQTGRHANKDMKLLEPKLAPTTSTYKSENGHLCAKPVNVFKCLRPLCSAASFTTTRLRSWLGSDVTLFPCPPPHVFLNISP